MSAAPAAHTVRRILVAIDSSPGSLATVEQAAELAARWGAELAGLFIEDQRLVATSEHGAAFEIGIYSARSRRLERDVVERALRAEAARVRRELERRIAGADVEWSFRVARGSVVDELERAARDTDLVVMGRLGWASSGRRIGSVARELADRCRTATVLVRARSQVAPARRRRGAPKPVVVVWDRSAAADRALAWAASFQFVDGQEILVLSLSEDDRDALATLVAERFGDRPVRAESIGDRDLELVARRLAPSGAALLVVPIDGLRVDDPRVMALAETLDCPTLVVR